MIIKYNDGFDVEHYPIDDWHRETLEKVCRLYNLPRRSWAYQATIHGRCFWAILPTSPRRSESIHCAEAGVRFIDFSPSMVCVRMTHRQPSDNIFIARTLRSRELERKLHDIWTAAAKTGNQISKHQLTLAQADQALKQATEALEAVEAIDDLLDWIRR